MNAFIYIYNDKIFWEKVQRKEATKKRTKEEKTNKGSNEITKETTNEATDRTEQKRIKRVVLKEGGAWREQGVKQENMATSVASPLKLKCLDTVKSTKGCPTKILNLESFLADQKYSTFHKVSSTNNENSK